MHHGWIWIDITVADMSIIYEGNRSSDDVVLDYLAMLGSDEGVYTDQDGFVYPADGLPDELQSPVGSLSYVPTPNPAEPDRTIRVEYMSDILCPIARNLPICTLTSFIETAVHRAISAVRPPDVHPYPVDITVIINSPFGERIMPLAPADHAITFTVTDPPPPPNPPKPPQRPSQSWDERPALLDHKHAFKYLIEYELAYNDLKQCTFPLGQKDDPNFSLEHRSARFDPMSRLNILSRMLRNYFQVLLSGTSWLDDPIPSDGVLECVWTFMRQVVEDGDRRALKDLHLFLDPKF